MQSAKTNFATTVALCATLFGAIMTGEGGCASGVNITDPNAQGNGGSEGGGECTAAADCAGTDDGCKKRKCTENKCGFDYAPAGSICNGTGSCDESGVCKLGNGSPCSLSTQCFSGNCIDGVCCNTACAETCQTCSGQGNNGICAAIHDGSDPGNECVDGTCNGSGACTSGMVACDPNATLSTSAISGNATEGGADATYAVVLNAKPCSDVTITLSGDAQVTASPSTVVFTASNWSQPRTITASAVFDFLIEGAHGGTITQAMANGSTSIVKVPIEDRAHLTHVSVPLAGTGTDAASTSAAVNDDGRHVAFLSAARNLVVDDANKLSEVFVRDLKTGTTKCVSRGAAANANGSSTSVAISSDGDKIGFTSNATNIVGVPIVSGEGDAYVHAQAAGTTALISPQCSGGCSNEFTPALYLSNDGAYASFSTRRQSVENPSDSEFDVFRTTVGTSVTIQASLNSAGANGTNFWGSNAFGGAMSSTGRFIGFNSSAKNLGSPEIAVQNFHAYVKDLATGVLTRVSRHSGGDTNCDGAFQAGGSDAPLISTDGNLAVFGSSCPIVVAPGGIADTNSKDDIFVRDIANKTTVRVSVATDGKQANGNSRLLGISDDARHILFWSDATNLIASDTNGAPDVFVRDRMTSTTARVGLDRSYGEIASGVTTAQMSHDGRFVVFVTVANLLPSDANSNIADVYLIQLR
jgi:Tol biopolymer transport system component